MNHQEYVDAQKMEKELHKSHLQLASAKAGFWICAGLLCLSLAIKVVFA